MKQLKVSNKENESEPQLKPFVKVDPLNDTLNLSLIPVVAEKEEKRAPPTFLNTHETSNDLSALINKLNDKKPAQSSAYALFGNGGAGNKKESKNDCNIF